MAVAKGLPKAASLGDALDAWGRMFHGRDVHPEFVKACRRRLVLAAGGVPTRIVCLSGLSHTIQEYPHR